MSSMRIKIKYLEPNPFRDLSNYPFNQEKLEQLKKSINQTGFWDNLLVRPKPGHTVWEDGIQDGNEPDEMNAPGYIGKNGDDDYVDPIFEISYGHHRLKVIQKLLGGEHEVDVPVKELDDATMLKIMANENMDEWQSSIAIIDETVRAVRTFLSSKKSGEGQEHVILADFLGWSEHAVALSLSRINAIDKAVLDKKAVELMPSAKSAATFATATKKAGLSTQQQRKVAKKIKTSGNYSTKGVVDAINVEVRGKDIHKQKERKEGLIKIDDLLKDVSAQAGDLSIKLSALIQLKRNLNDDQDIIVKKWEALGTKTSLEHLVTQINNLLNTNKNE